jgi:hypothetical protein
VEDASSELRLFLQGICCDYLLFRHLDEGLPPEAIRIRQEVALGAGAFADIEVRAGQAPPYFVEVNPAARPLPRCRRPDGRSLLVLELRPRHARRGGVAPRADVIRLHDAPPDRQRQRDALS